MSQLIVASILIATANEFGNDAAGIGNRNNYAATAFDLSVANVKIAEYDDWALW